MHAAGHALLAAAGGVLARALAGGAGPMDDRSIRTLESVGAGDPMLGLAIGGLLAAVAKLAGGVMAGWAEARVAGEVGAELRLEVLDRVLRVNSLRAPRQRDHGLAQRAQIGDASRDGGGDRGDRGDRGDGVERVRRVRRVHGGGAQIADLASLTTHIADVERGVAGGVFAEVRALLQLAPLVVLLAILAPRLAGSAALALGGFSALVMVARRALKRGRARAAREAEALLGAADEAVRHADLWATYGAERRIRAHLASLGAAIVTTTASLRARSALLSGTSEVLGALALVLTLALVGAGAIGGVERGAIVPFAIAFFMAYKPLREMVEARLARARAEEALAEMVADAHANAHANANAKEPSESTEEEHRSAEWPLRTLTVDGIVAEHGTHAPLSVRIEPGRIAAIVGPTGVGKTSLLRVLLGLDVPRQGTVAWGGQDLTLRGVGPRERPFAWVPQDAPVLGDTLVANVLLAHGGFPSRDGDDAARVLEELGAGGLAASLGDAVLATERSVSGGERQWIAVARALATRLPVLLLDEPTASLDGPAQERMLRAIAGLRGKRTVLIVTHRPEPLAIADVIVRLEREDAEAPDATAPRAPSHGEDAEHRTCGHAHALGPVELTIEDVGAVALREAEHELERERVDVQRAEERSAREHER